MQNAVEKPMDVEVGPRRLAGILRIPKRAFCLVAFAHGSGSCRFSPRNTLVAEEMGARGIATLLFDLLDETEAQDRSNVFDIPLLGRRMIEAVSWLGTDPRTAGFSVGLFGSSTGAAAALVAAAAEPDRIGAVVSRGGRPDLAGEALNDVKAPTILIVGADDHGVIELNERAAKAMRCETRLVLVPGATHLFEESGTLDQVVDHACRWFETHLRNEAAT